MIHYTFKLTLDPDDDEEDCSDIARVGINPRTGEIIEIRPKS